ncbi:alpha-glucosidase [Actinophytocola gossypii]|uniref:Alpha-glucosidase n=1 Tax=Actinophytocola gossypii TaxID=2812003 RepID=A0ABT2J3S7_9PSEU|nr:alpha-glucosidase [Actinophytocola gossypii]MCT2582406.1 alpha-glucosidase [Actinophytocola gossypii]
MSRPGVRVTLLVVIVALLASGVVAVVGLSVLNGRYAPPAPLPEPGRVSVADGALVDTETGHYRVVTGERGLVVVDAEGTAVFGSRDGRSALAAVRGHVDWREHTGHFTATEHRAAVWTSMRVGRVDAGSDQVTVAGELAGSGQTVPFELRLGTGDPHRLAVSVRVPGADGVVLRVRRDGGEAVHGLGAQFSGFDLSGKFVPVVTREQGVGRGRQPLTMLAEATEGAGGAEFSTYAPVPFAMVGGRRAVALDTTRYSTWDLRRPDLVDVTHWHDEVDATVYTGDRPADLLALRTEDTGRPDALPGWALDGAIVGLQGGSDQVRRKLAALRDAPVAAVWLQDWTGGRRTDFGDRLWWTWQVDRERYPDWERLVADLGERDIRVLTYVNPFLVDAAGRSGRNLFREAEAAGYLVRDQRGGPYLLDQGGFSAALVDLSNPAAVDWYVEVIATEVASAGIAGWMADFGEGLPFDAVLHGGDPEEWHNRWPDEWARVNAAACRRAALPDCLVFHRSAGQDTAATAPLLWAGDQLVDFGAADGMTSALHGMLAAGASGMPLTHSDTGGYTGLAQPLVGVRRTPEVLRRWTELSAWGLLLRTHEGNRPAENAQVYDDAGAAAAFAEQARVFAALADYRAEVVAEAAATGMPVLRHVRLVHPERPWPAGSDDQFLFGPSFLVAPVLEPGATTVTAHLPPGRWVHLWTGTEHGDTGSVSSVTVAAPPGRPAVFFPVGDRWGQRIRDRVVTGSGTR